MSARLADVKTCAKKAAAEKALAGIATTYRLVLSKPGTRFVACSDKAELETVRKNFLEKTLGLAGGALDASIKSVCEAMKASRSKSRLTVCYLLAEHHGKLAAFG